MKEFETLKLYGKSINNWVEREDVICENGYKYTKETLKQVGVEYTEYDANGEMIATGTRDFKYGSPDGNSIKMYTIWAWDGKTYNKGGYRRFTECQTVRIDRHDRSKLTELAPKWYPEAAAINIR